jgi:hypothetical protein
VTLGAGGLGLTGDFGAWATGFGGGGNGIEGFG